MNDDIHPVRFPPPLMRSRINADGLYEPVMQKPFVECGQRVQLGGTWVECIRPHGHAVFINWGHTNGYEEWCFDAPALPPVTEREPE